MFIIYTKLTMIIRRDCVLNHVWNVVPTTKLADADNYYNKTEIDKIMSEGGQFNPLNYYTKVETDTAINEKGEEIELSLKDLFLQKMEAARMLHNYASVEEDKLILNSENI